MPALMLSVLLLAAPAEAPDTLVVCPDAFVDALQPWVNYRTQQGHRIKIVTNRGTAGQIRSVIRNTAQSGKLKFVLLVGDADPAATADRRVRAVSVPTHHEKAKVNIHWGSEPEIASDNWYADLDDDQLPDVAIGRLTADTGDELALIVRKILNYERQTDFGLWRRRVNFVAGVGGFGKIADSVLEMATKRLLADGIPLCYATTMTYGSWQSPYCPDPRHFHDATLARMNEGCLFWVYIGHGQRRYLDQVRVPGRRYHILSTEDVDKIQSQAGAPIAVFLACYTGAFDEPEDCLAEEMLRREAGPVAILAGSRVTMPYAMAVMSNEMMKEFFRSRRATLGEVVMHAKRRMIEPIPDDDQEKLSNRDIIEAVATAISPSADMLDDERLEHLALFNLLGDPLLRLHHPKDLGVTASKDVVAGTPLNIKIVSPHAGLCTVELVCRRDGLRFRAPSRNEFDATDDALSAYTGVYREAIDQRWHSQSFELTAEQTGQELQVAVPVPANVFGPCHVRIHVGGQSGFALGAADVFIRRPRD